MEKHTLLCWKLRGRKKETPGPGRGEQVQPIWHVELVSETYIQTQNAAGLSHSDPLLISVCLSILSLSVQHLLLPLSLQIPSLCFIPSLTCILFLLRLCLSLLVLLFSSAHVCSDGLFRLYLVKLQQNTSFRRQENRERCIIGVSQRFIVTQLQTRVHRLTFKQ